MKIVINVIWFVIPENIVAYRKHPSVMNVSAYADSASFYICRITIECAIDNFCIRAGCTIDTGGILYKNTITDYTTYSPKVYSGGRPDRTTTNNCKTLNNRGAGLNKYNTGSLRLTVNDTMSWPIFTPQGYGFTPKVDIPISRTDISTIGEHHFVSICGRIDCRLNGGVLRGNMSFNSDSGTGYKKKQ
ncbi:MAG: hypothetical protein FJ263_00500 [Planctomycetes bacterium]|nr:hypothetical protein [Planctomycetota bacterium]